MFITVASVQRDGLSLRDIVSDIPHDGPAAVIYVLIGLFIGLIWWGNRKSGDVDPPTGTGPSSRTD